LLSLGYWAWCILVYDFDCPDNAAAPASIVPPAANQQMSKFGQSSSSPGGQFSSNSSTTTLLFPLISVLVRILVGAVQGAVAILAILFCPFVAMVVAAGNKRFFDSIFDTLSNFGNNLSVFSSLIFSLHLPPHIRNNIVLAAVLRSKAHGDASPANEQRFPSLAQAAQATLQQALKSPDYTTTPPVRDKRASGPVIVLRPP